MKKQLKMIGAVTGCLAAAMVSYAAVIIDESGVGFVGKGDVQLLYGWNNAQLQQNANGLSFWYVTPGSTTSWECEWTTGPTHNRTRHSVKRESTVQGINTSVAYDSRKNNKGQITGFNLNGLGAVEVNANAPAAVGGCEAGKTLVVGSLQTNASEEDGGLWIQFDSKRIAFPVVVDQGEG